MGRSADRPRPSAEVVPAQYAGAHAGETGAHVRSGISASDAAGRGGSRGEGVPRHAPRHAAGCTRGWRGSNSRKGIRRSRDDARRHRRKERRTLASHRIGRFSQECRVWVQRRSHCELRTCRRSDWSRRKPAASGCYCRRRRGSHCRRTLDGVKRLPRLEE